MGKRATVKSAVTTRGYNSGDGGFSQIFSFNTTVASQVASSIDTKVSDQLSGIQFEFKSGQGSNPPVVNSESINYSQITSALVNSDLLTNSTTSKILDPNDKLINKNSSQYNPWATKSTNKSRIYTALTAIPSDEPLIISSIEVLPVSDTNFTLKLLDFGGSDFEGIGVDTSYDRDFSLILKKECEDLILSTAQNTFLKNKSHSAKTAGKILDSKNKFSELSVTQAKGSSLILQNLVDVISVLNPQKVLDESQDYPKGFSNIFTQEKCVLSSPFINTTSFNSLLSIIKKEIYTHSLATDLTSILLPEAKLSLNESIRTNSLSFKILNQTDSFPEQLVLPGGANKIIQNYFDKHFVLNRQKTFQTDVSLADIAAIGLVNARHIGGLSDILVTNGSGNIGIKKSFSGIPQFNNGIDNILRNLTVNSFKSSVGGDLLVPHAGIDFTKYFGLLSFLLFKEILFSSSCRNTPIRNYLSKNFGGYLPTITQDSTAANYDIWNVLIGELTREVTDFTNEDALLTNNATSAPSLARFTKQVINADSSQLSDPSTENVYRILTIEETNLDFGAGETLTPGALYYIDSALTGQANSQGDILPDTAKASQLLTKIQDARKSINAIKYLHRAKIEEEDSTLFQLQQLSEYRESITRAYREIATSDLVKFYESKIKIVAQSSKNFSEIPEDQKTKEIYNTSVAAIGKNGFVSRVLASLISRAWSLIYDSSYLDVKKKSVGENLLKAIFSIVLRRMYHIGMGEDGKTNHGAISSNGFEKFKPKFKIEVANLGLGEIQFVTPNFSNASPELKKEFSHSNRGLFFQTLIDTTGNAISPAMAIDAIIFSNPEIFKVFKDKAEASSATFWDLETRKTPKVSFTSQTPLLKNAAANSLLLKGESYFHNLVVYSDLNGTNGLGKKNFLLDKIAELLSKFHLAVKDRSPFRTAGADNSNLLAGRVTTCYGDIDASVMLWNYFLLIVDAIRRVTPESLIGVLDFSTYDSKDDINTVSYVTEFGYNLGIDQSFKYINETDSPNETKGSYSFWNTKLNYRDTIDPVINSFIEQQKVCSDHFSRLTLYLSVLENRVSNFINFLKSPIADVKKYYNELNSAANSEVSSLPDDASRSSLKRFLVSSGFAQEQLLLSRNIGDEIKRRTDLDLNSFYSAVVNLKPGFYSEKGSLFQTQEFTISDKPAVIGISEFISLNATDQFAYNPLVRQFFIKNDKFTSINTNNRRILSIGIPPRMVRNLNKTPALQTSLNYSSSVLKNLIKIKVYKNDVLNTPGIYYKPKTFVFDMYRFPTRDLALYKEVDINGSLDDLIASIPTKVHIPNSFLDQTIIKQQITENGLFARNYAVSEYSAVVGKNTAIDFKSLYNNHVESFLLEEYVNMFTRARLDESYYYHYVNLDATMKNMESQFNNYLSTTNLQFNESNLPDDFLQSVPANERLRVVKQSEETIKRYFMNETFFMSSDEIRKRIFLPKKFDRVFTVAVDSDEFEIDQTQFDDTKQQELAEKYISEGKLVADENGIVKKSSDITLPSEIYVDEYWVEIEPALESELPGLT